MSADRRRERRRGRPAARGTFLALALALGPLAVQSPLAAQGPTATRGAFEYKMAPGPHAVKTVLYDWKDAKRDRPVPVKIYYPADLAGPAPLIVFSHGLGGTREGYEYLGRQWAGYGYISLHIQHAGSDDAVWRGQANPLEAMRKAAADPRNAVDRARDVSFAIDEMARIAGRPGPFEGRVDLGRVGVAGHSFGANTALVSAGQVFVLPNGQALGFADPRIKAAVPMSAPVPRRRQDLDRAFGGIAIPCLHMTGTRDDSPIGETKAVDRRLPFDHISRADQFLVVFNGGDHMIFSGRPRTLLAGKGVKDDVFQALIRQATTAFWDAYLLGEPRARTWLLEGGLLSLLGTDGALEIKIFGRRTGSTPGP